VAIITTAVLRPNFRRDLLPGGRWCHGAGVSTPVPFSAMVLSAGYGTRLRPLTDEIPKPLVPIGDTPLLGRHLCALHQAGARILAVNTHHHSQQIASYINELPFLVHVSHEEKILGTAGGIANVRAWVEPGPLLVVNGDIMGQLPVASLLSSAGPGLTLAVTTRQVGKGTVGLGAGGEVVRLRGETFGREVRAGDYMGVALLGQECLQSLPSEGCLIGDWALPELRKNRPIQTVMVEETFEDVGTPEHYLRANMNWLKGRENAHEFSHMGTGVQVDAQVEVVRSLVGHGARISGRGRVVGSLILPGAHARAPLTHAIVTPSGRVIQVGGAE
jgi:mannose-1-phosphate guanylyltransferase